MRDDLVQADWTSIGLRIQMSDDCRRPLRKEVGFQLDDDLPEEESTAIVCHCDFEED